VQQVRPVLRVQQVALALQVQQALQAALESRVLLEASARQAVQAQQVRQASLGLRRVQLWLRALRHQPRQPPPDLLQRVGFRRLQASCGRA
jgi:hypothetical protein